MPPKNIDIIISKLEKLEEYLKILKDISKSPKNKFILDYKLYGLAERFLQLSIEIILDVGKIVCIELKFDAPSNNHEIFEILAKEKVISKKLFTSLKGIAGFRNILVHDYMKIDRNIVYDNLKEIKDFDAFLKAIKKKIFN